jgi:hypothetical protein
MRRGITLVRHGRSAHVHRDGWVDGEGLRRWYTAYERAGIDPTDPPPPALVAEAERAGFITASDAPRAVASAERLVAGARPVVLSPLLRELDLEVPGWVNWPMPLAGWALAVGMEELRASHRGGQTASAALGRVEAAADWLSHAARVHGSVLAVTHGNFRRKVAARLVDRGWQITRRRGGLRPWSSWDLAAPACVRS